ncbi:hypothetical protein KGF54_001975 [Candida jiufengensis]|uniref:uncharacterized protein n=1 Tax=Candida jiufengensis TaxID=497108 RepID=UPI002224418D|nr:uncharacterized protein KGF54_001975 [Candida jiufengensis]KAI5954200.1 hypothetical protein KGF54_001975 [Candida jiufengensis]
MNISRLDRKLLNNSNIYNACNGDYHENRAINRKYLVDNKESINHKLIKTPQGIKIIIDKSASDLDDVFFKYGNSFPPDDLLDMIKPGHLKIPIVYNSNLPSSDLLKAIHYFVSKKYSHDEKDTVINEVEKNGKRSRLRKDDKKRIPKYLDSMDESSLLFMGMLIESWCDDLITEDVCKMFLTKEQISSDEEDDSNSSIEETSSDEEESEESEWCDSDEREQLWKRGKPHELTTTDEEESSEEEDSTESSSLSDEEEGENINE